MKHFRDLLPVASLPVYLLWHIRQNKPLLCHLRSGLKLSIRPHPSRDYDTAFEIFFAKIYACEIARDEVRRVVDLGGNIGYSCLYWCMEYPSAEVITFEPHPLHCEILQWHIERNAFSSRVRLFKAAAGTRDAQVKLSDADTASSIVSKDGRDSITVPLLDLFQTLPAGKIDILKIDIEGAEREILSDDRFSDLAGRTKIIHLEWHAAADSGGQYCLTKLLSLGFDARFVGHQDGERGMIYATKEPLDG